MTDVLPPFVRSEGRIVLRLDREGLEVLTGLPGYVRELMSAAGGRVPERLFPHAYLDPTEEEAEDEWQRLMHDDLLQGKVEALDTMAATLERAGPEPTVRIELDDDEVAAWLGALNDARLALGTLLDVSEDLDLQELDPDDSRIPALTLYHWLTFLQSELIDVLAP